MHNETSDPQLTPWSPSNDNRVNVCSVGRYTVICGHDVGTRVRRSVRWVLIDL